MAGERSAVGERGSRFGVVCVGVGCVCWCVFDGGVVCVVVWLVESDMDAWIWVVIWDISSLFIFVFWIHGDVTWQVFCNMPCFYWFERCFGNWSRLFSQMWVSASRFRSLLFVDIILFSDDHVDSLVDNLFCLLELFCYCILPTFVDIANDTFIPFVNFTNFLVYCFFQWRFRSMLVVCVIRPFRFAFVQPFRLVLRFEIRQWWLMVVQMSCRQFFWWMWQLWMMV